jgi:hypothetical protein
MKKSRKLACHVVNSNIAIGSLATIALFEKIYDGKPILTVFSRMYNSVVSIKCMM